MKPHKPDNQAPASGGLGVPGSNPGCPMNSHTKVWLFFYTATGICECHRATRDIEEVYWTSLPSAT
jgi:hypothetical protein